eukprot:11107849-Alexandrium_andersonii.AAC.1
MSASLVGSEMCIRDRPSWGLSLPAPAAISSGRVCVLASAGLSSTTRCSCLLYTSDAADDM